MTQRSLRSLAPRLHRQGPEYRYDPAPVAGNFNKCHRCRPEARGRGIGQLRLRRVITLSCLRPNRIAATSGGGFPRSASSAGVHARVASDGQSTVVPSTLGLAYHFGPCPASPTPRPWSRPRRSTAERESSGGSQRGAGGRKTRSTGRCSRPAAPSMPGGRPCTTAAAGRRSRRGRTLVAGPTRPVIHSK